MMPMFRTLFRSVSTSCATWVLRFISFSELWGAWADAYVTSVAGSLGAGVAQSLARLPKLQRGLPAVVREGLVGVCHLVRVFAALDCSAETVRCVEDLVGETLGHRLLATALGVGGEPAQCESVCTVRLDLDGHLVGRSTDTAGANLKGGAHVVECLLQGDNGIRTILGRNGLECVVNDALSEGLLAV